jgi:hypothetical protein
MNALSILDPEQANVAPGPDSRLAVLGGLSYAKNGAELMVSGFGGKRAATTNGTPGVAVPEVDRRWVILNAAYDRAGQPFSARAEYMTGKDRVPGTSTAPLMNGTDMRAGYLQLGYRFSPLDGLYGRYEFWDRNTAANGFDLSGFGLSYIRDLTPSIRLVGAYERFRDQVARDFGITTLRLQYRF